MRQWIFFLQFLFLSFVLITKYSSANEVLSLGPVLIDIDSSGNYQIYLNGNLWFKSGPLGFYQNSNWALNTGANLKMTDLSTFSGNDVFGKFLGVKMHWQSNQGTPFETHFRVYSNFIIFDQVFTTGLSGCSLGTRDQLFSSFPSFSTKSGKVPSLPYMSFYGNFAQPYYGKGLSSFIGGVVGGVPTVFYDEYETVIISPMDNFFVGYHTVNQPGLENTLTCGLEGLLDSVPAGYVHSTILYYSQNGMTDAMYQWGDLMLKKTNKVRATPNSDFIISHLGYWTDNGAYYYYFTEGNTTYDKTMYMVKDYYEQEGVPIRYMQLDSWWYFKDDFDAVSIWTAREDILPTGMADFVSKIGMPLILHNRYWSPTSPYSDMFGWVSDTSFPAKFALPNDTDFWSFLFDQSSSWGLATYEQDWLIDQTEGTKQLQTDIHLGSNWLNQMSKAAEDHGLTIQYCMPLPLHVLHSTHCSAVTQIRASDDYLHGPSQWNIGINSMLAWSLGMIPFKDVLWTTTYQPGNPRYSSDIYEANPEMQVIVAALSTGPIGIGDGIGMTNTSLIKRACMTDGKILKPDKPATNIDKTWTSSAPKGHVWDTYTKYHSGLEWHQVFAVDIRQDFALYPSDIHLSSSSYLYYEQLGSSPPKNSSLHTFSSSSPLVIPASTLDDSDVTYHHDPVYEYHLYLVAPIIPENGWCVLGERNKIVPISKQRMPSVSSDETSLVLGLRGVPGELVVFDLYSARSGSIHSVTCLFGDYAIATITCSLESCKCNPYQ